MFQRLSTPLVLALALALPSVAHAADSVGASGYVRSLQVNGQSSDSYAAMHGRVFVGNKYSSSEYRWGGISCGSQVLDPEQVSLLNQALVNGIKITPLHRSGQGNVKCLVGFTLKN